MKTLQSGRRCVAKKVEHLVEKGIGRSLGDHGNPVRRVRVIAGHSCQAHAIELATKVPGFGGPAVIVVRDADGRCYLPTVFEEAPHDIERFGMSGVGGLAEPLPGRSAVLRIGWADALKSLPVLALCLR